MKDFAALFQPLAKILSLYDRLLNCKNQAENYKYFRLYSIKPPNRLTSTKGPRGDTARNDSQLRAVAAKATAPYKDVPASETTKLLIALKVNLLIQAAEEKKTAFASKLNTTVM
ncbi:hypothetical protein CDAR_502301 [Caerostris darwini]|uniref:Uncharacterized protein n=1 Tax=Caerostris darwini TaxID=1538125 RepID=A0AAV4R5I8_9ARAC|nr:hypothetical protein CDAR_502301 [Caerostris darwini]